MGTSAVALVGFASVQIVLTFMLAVFRTSLVLTGQKEANTFSPDGSDVPGFGQRLTRARDNCFENLPMFAALVLVASVTGNASVTDPLAMWVLLARIGQAATHVLSTSVPAIQVRFAFYLVQLGIMAWWALRLLLG